MKKSCCIEDVNITPRNSSCSMILRSDCSHGSSRKSFVINTNLEDTPPKEKFIDKFNERKLSELDTKNSLEIDSHFCSSLKRISYKSAETYSVIGESLYSKYEHSDYQNNNALNGIGTHPNFDREGYSLSSSSNLNNNSIFQKECSLINNNYITSTYSDIMSKSRDFSKSKSTANVLSDSETEDGSIQGKLRKRRSNRTLSSKLQSSTERTESLMTNNSNHTTVKNFNSGSHADNKLIDSPFITSSNYHTPSSSVVYNNNFKRNSGSDHSYSPSSISPIIDISSVQYTPVDRFRWFLWRSIYLKIIKCVNFDVWLLSRLHKYRRFIILFLLLPLLLYILYGALLDESRNNNYLADFSSNVIAFPSYVYSIISSPFFRSGEISTSENESSCSTKFSDVLYYILFGVVQFLSNCLTSLGKLFSTSSNPTKSDTVILTKSLTDKEDVKSIAIEVLEERLSDVVMKIQKSQRAYNVENVKEDSIMKIQNDITKLRLEFQTLVEAVQKLEKDFTLKSKGSFVKYDNMIEEHNGHLKSINSKMEEFEGKLSSLNGVLKSCCDDKWTISDFANSFENHFLRVLKNIVDRGKEQNSPYFFFHEWLHSKMEYDKDSLSKKLKLELEKFETTGRKYDENIEKIVENVVQKHVEMLKKTNTFDKIELSSEDTDINIVQKLIKEAIMLYDADKTGKVDYALESGGGSVLSTRCSESYAEKDGTISVLGFPLWSTHNSPRTAIQPDMQPGQCWAFKGSRGFLVIQLSYTIYPTGFTLEHIPVSLSPSGSIDSAPREFSVWGLTSEKDNDGKSLGNYTYDLGGEPLQYFPVQTLYDEPFSFVELRINSNHGNLDYTCLYRFRVHGKQPKY